MNLNDFIERMIFLIVCFSFIENPIFHPAIIKVIEDNIKVKEIEIMFLFFSKKKDGRIEMVDISIKTKNHLKTTSFR